MTNEPSRKIFVNLAAAALGKAMEFFTQLGFSFDPRWMDPKAPEEGLAQSAQVS